MKTVCVTGHRPAKLPWGYKKEGPDYDEYIESLACTIADYLENGYDHFITGMALGVDMDFAETVIQLGSITTLTSSWNALSPVRIRP